ncbi:MAG: cation transporter, partial [Bacteroidetes bacterium]|nr:cation transporter [Fibrella sp.]
NALTAHLVLQPGLTHTEERTLKREIRHRLEHLNISHVTLEIDADAGDCQDGDC